MWSSPQSGVIEATGGTLVERFRKPAVYGGAEGLRFRILLAGRHTVDDGGR